MTVLIVSSDAGPQSDVMRWYDKAVFEDPAGSELRRKLGSADVVV
jgi:hypothetical protein